MDGECARVFRSRRKWWRVWSRLGLTTAFPAVSATVASDPVLKIDVSLGGEHDTSFKAGSAPSGSAMTTVETTLSLALDHGVTVLAKPIFEPVVERDRPRFVADYGLYLEQAFISVATPVVTVSAGKFNPVIGLANDEAPGISARTSRPTTS